MASGHPAGRGGRTRETIRLEALDWTGGQISDNDDPNEVRDVDLTQVHYLAGPVRVEGAEPGDLLKVEFHDMGPLNDRSEFGFTGTFSQQNGGGFLTDHFPDAAKSIWEIDGYTVSSRHVPDVRYEGKIHPGLAGCAPSQELLEEWNEREQELIDKHEEDPSSIPNHPTGEAEPGVANPPTTEGAQMGEMDPDAAEEAAKEAARTVPPREHGGNHDIKDLSIGSTVYFPVYVEGANFALGDFHASQGDGEITFCGAIEMAGYADVEFDLVKNGMEEHGVDHPDLRARPPRPQLRGLHHVLRLLRDGGRRAALHRLAHRLPPGVSTGDRLPQEVRLHGPTGAPHPWHRPGRGASERRRRRPERVLDVGGAEGRLRVRHLSRESGQPSRSRRSCRHRRSP